MATWNIYACAVHVSSIKWQILNYNLRKLKCSLIFNVVFIVDTETSSFFLFFSCIAILFEGGGGRGQKTHMSATTRVLVAVVFWWICRCNCWRWWSCWWYWNWRTATLFHTNWCSCSHIIRKSTPWMSYNRHPINHCANFFSLTSTGFLRNVRVSNRAHKCALTSTQSQFKEK